MCYTSYAKAEQKQSNEKKKEKTQRTHISGEVTDAAQYMPCTSFNNSLANDPASMHGIHLHGTVQSAQNPDPG